MQLGTHVLRNTLFAAPMAGVTDRVFRRLAKRYGAGLAFTEMVSSRPELRASRKSLLRVDHAGEPGPVAVQIAGADPQLMADAARHNVALGAQIIDINMGCPAKKVCNVLAGSALLDHEALVGRILDAVVAAVPVPVTLKTRTGPHPGRRNAVHIARIAESAGVQMLTLHGRTRACGFSGRAEYDTIAEVKSRVAIPVIANGDLDTPEDAARVLARTRADGVMIGRAALGQPWVFRDYETYLRTGARGPAPDLAEVRAVLEEHLEGLYTLYGVSRGVRIARKHIGWTARGLPGGDRLRQAVNATEDPATQRLAVGRFFDRLAGACRLHLDGQPPARMAA